MNENKHLLAFAFAKINKISGLGRNALFSPAQYMQNIREFKSISVSICSCLCKCSAFVEYYFIDRSAWQRCRNLTNLLPIEPLKYASIWLEVIFR